MRLRPIAREGVFLLLLILAGTVVPATAQGVGSIGGTVADTSGGVLPGVNVTLTAAAGGVGRGQTTVTTQRNLRVFSRRPGDAALKTVRLKPDATYARSGYRLK